MDRLLRLGAGMPGLSQAPPHSDASVVDTAEQVYISSLALLKMLKHGRAGVPMEVMGAYFFTLPLLYLHPGYYEIDLLYITYGNINLIGKRYKFNVSGRVDDDSVRRNQSGCPLFDANKHIHIIMNINM